MFLKIVNKKTLFAAVSFTWLAYLFDYLFFFQLNMDKEKMDISIALLFLARVLSYIVATFALLYIQFDCEAKLKFHARKHISGDYAFHYSSVPNHLSHYFIPSLIRIGSELPALVIFILTVLQTNNNIFQVYSYAIISILTAIVGLGLIQRILAKKALVKRQQYDNYVDSVNHSWLEIRKISDKALNYVQRVVSIKHKEFIYSATSASLLSQTVRLQLELMIALLIYFDSSLLGISASIGYVFYRLASSSLLLFQSFMSFQGHREYWKYIN
jgi:hypothetical protein